MDKKQKKAKQELIEQEFDKETLDRLRRLRLMDDDFMSKCFEDNIECAELVVRIILNRNDLKVERIHKNTFSIVWAETHCL